MNKKLISKLVKLKIQEYNLFKEFLPDCIKKEVNSIESRAVNIAKEIAVEIISTSTTDNEEIEEKKIKKVTVES